MQLLVLAAGAGKRIKPVVTSKPLLPFKGRTLLERVVAGCRPLQPEKTVIVVSPQDQNQVTQLFPRAEIVVQEQPTGMAGAVQAARRVLEGPVVIVNGDDLIGPEAVSDFYRQIRVTPATAVLTGIKAKTGYSGGFFALQGGSLKVVEKPEKKPSEWAKIVLDYFPDIKEFLTVLKDDYEAGLNQLNLIMVKVKGKFYQLKYPWQILDLTAGLLTGKNEIDPGAKVMAGSDIINSYLGPGVTVGQNCLIRDSIIEAGSVVGFGTEIARSYIGPNNWFHRNYIGDSVVEGESNFGAGAVTANFRFDHKPIEKSGREKFGAVVGRGAQVGVNASLMPGTGVPAGEIVWPGEVRR